MSSSLNSVPMALVMPNRWTKIVSGPTARIMSRSDWSKPRIIAVMPTIDVMPMTTPRMVSAERILFERTVSKAITTTSLIRPIRIATWVLLSLLVAQGFDRIEARGLDGGIHPEKDADRG